MNVICDKMNVTIEKPSEGNVVMACGLLQAELLVFQGDTYHVNVSGLIDNDHVLIKPKNRTFIGKRGYERAWRWAYRRLIKIY
jgi:hypothetical protein